MHADGLRAEGIGIKKNKEKKLMAQMSEYKEKTKSVLTLQVVSMSVRMRWCADADDCKEEKKNGKKKKKTY